MHGLNAVLRVLMRLPRLLLIGVVRGYRLLFSPWVGQSCRFTPTCSAYAIGALERHGAVVGSGLAAWRILRCNPLCHGGCDPVPDNMPWERAQAAPAPSSATGLFTGLLQRDSGDAPAAAGPATVATADPTLSKTLS
jgi:putative membrane protein insertion efficiency factor